METMRFSTLVRILTLLGAVILLTIPDASSALTFEELDSRLPACELVLRKCFDDA